MKPHSRSLWIALFLVALFTMVSMGGVVPVRVSAHGPQGQSTKPAPQKGVAPKEDSDEGEDPDLPRFANGKVDKEAYMRARQDNISLIRGVDLNGKFDPSLRVKAIRQLELQAAANAPVITTAAWTQIGPAPIPNGQTQTTTTAVSGRVTVVEIDPTNSSRLYVGTAQGGVYRSLDGGTTWAAIFDGAQSLAIGALALVPTDPTTLYVGTGEANGSCDSFAGVGLYRIDTVTTTPVLVGPINPVRNYNDAGGNPQSVPAFNGRSISKILVNPTDPGSLLVGTAGGVIGIGCDSPLGGAVPPLSTRGLYRLANADGDPAGVTVEKIPVATTAVAGGCFDLPCTANRSVNDMVYDPADTNILTLWLNGINVSGDGGIWRSTNAQSASPTFTQVFTTTATSTSNGRGVFAIYKQGANPTVIYEGSGEASTGGTLCNSSANQGALRRSTDGGATWSAKLPGGGGFCGGQCFYNLGLAVVPGATTATDTVYVAGNVQSANCAKLLGKSLDGAATVFANLDNGLHADTHVVKIDPNNSSVIYHGNDGGIYKSTNAAASWTSLNNTGFHATQFQSIATHPTDQFYTIGGTQDNGTEFLQPTNIWTRADAGDGGFAMIDQNAVNTTNVTMYHTYFNQAGTQIGYARATTAGGAWSFLGCSGSGTTRGISCTNTVNFYAPTALGPGSPNVVYLGTDRLYRSTDTGNNNTIVSQAPLVSGVPISSIAISPLSDLVRVVGLNDGSLFYTTTGSSTLTNLDPSNMIPNKYVGRIKVDPNNSNTVYIALAGYTGATTPDNSHVWKVTNLSTTPVITAINGSGPDALPDVPVNGFVVDPVNSNVLYAGTDIGVYRSTDAGANWMPFGTGLPIVAVFDMEIAQKGTTSEILRIATHGRGMWEISLAPTLAKVVDINASRFDDGRVLVEWQTGSEVNNLGFNIYREQDGQRIRVTPQLVAGAALVTGAGRSLLSGHTYQWADIPPANARKVSYWLEDVDLNGQSSWTGPIEIKLAHGKKSDIDLRSVTLGSLGMHQAQVTGGVGTEIAERAAEVRTLTPAAQASQTAIASAPAVKIGVKQEGWYRVSMAELLAAGLNPNADPRNLKVFVDGQEIPIVVKNAPSGSPDAVEFYAVGLDSVSSNIRTYWVVATDTPGLRISPQSGKAGTITAGSFPYTVQRKDRTIYFSALKNGEKENFFGPVVSSSPIDQTLTLTHVAQSDASATLEVAMQGVTRLAHAVTITLNGEAVGTLNFAGQAAGVARLSIPQSKLKEGSNIVRLTGGSSGQDVSLIDSISITYQHSYIADSDALQLTAEAGRQITIDGFTSASVRVVDATNPDSVQELAATVKSGKSGFSVTATAQGSGDRTLLAFGDSQVRHPVSIVYNQPSNWRQSTTSADLIIITRQDFMTSVQPLVSARQNQGLSVAVVDVEDIYDEFSFGHKSPQALKDFILYARNSWATPARFALLVGDGSFDPKDYLGYGNADLVPSKLIDSQFVETASDDWYADSNEDGLAEIAVGRLPVRTAQEAAVMISKIVAFDRQGVTNSVLLVSDSNDGYNFEAASAQVRGIIPAGINVEQIDRGQVGTLTAKSQLIDAIARGQKIVNYTGHGNATIWRDNLLTAADARKLTNRTHLPLFVTMSCLNGYYQDPVLDSLAESLMKAERGGAVAVWASSGLTEPSGQVVMDRQVFQFILNSTGSGMRLGEAVLGAKASVYDGDLRRTWILFGDPTMRLR